MRTMPAENLGIAPVPAPSPLALPDSHFRPTLPTVITVNMSEAKTRLSALVKAVEETNETVILQRHGTPVAELRRYKARRQPKLDRLKTHPQLKVTFAPGYRPTEPLRPDELAD
jgi:prevent-host-death family protein